MVGLGLMLDAADRRLLAQLAVGAACVVLAVLLAAVVLGCAVKMFLWIVGA